MDFSGILIWLWSFAQFIEPYLIVVLTVVLVAAIVSVAAKKKRKQLDELQPDNLKEDSVAATTKTLHFVVHKPKEDAAVPSQETGYRVVQEFDTPGPGYVMGNNSPVRAAESSELRRNGMEQDDVTSDKGINDYMDILKLNELISTYEKREEAIARRIRFEEESRQGVLKMLKSAREYRNEKFESMKRELEMDPTTLSAPSNIASPVVENGAPSKQSTEALIQSVEVALQESKKEEPKETKKEKKAKKSSKEKEKDFQWEEEKSQEDLEQEESSGDSETVTVSEQTAQSDPATEPKKEDSAMNEQSKKKPNRKASQQEPPLAPEQVEAMKGIHRK